MGSSSSSKKNYHNSKNVDIVFSDKTGTLTKNSFELCRCLVWDKIYGNMKDDQKEKPRFHINGDQSAFEILNSDDYDYFESLEKNPQKAKLIEFLWNATLCHNVIAEKDALTGEIKFESGCTRDYPLIKAAKDMGYVFSGRNNNIIEIFDEHKQKTQTWEILYEIPFNSERKMETVIVRNRDNIHGNPVFVFSKGVPQNILPLMNVSEYTYPIVLYSLDKFTSEGLRCLALGMKVIKGEEYSDWYSKICTLKSSGKDEQLESIELNELHKKMEIDFNFTGITAIRDTLQEGVVDTIHDLLQSGIRSWILTGDRKEPTLRLAEQCGIVDEKASNISIDFTGNQDANEIEGLLNNILKELEISELNDFQKLKTIKTKKNYLLSVEGVVMKILLENENLFSKLLKLAVVSKFVFFYRVNPSDKMNIIKTTKKLTNFMTLCVGESTADIPMMMEADIKASIKNKDNTGVNEIPSYAIKGFNGLKDLLLVEKKN